MERVQLESVFRWVCPECRTINFLSLEHRRATDDEALELLGRGAWEMMDEGEAVELAFIPSEAMCKKCADIFMTDLPEGWAKADD